MPFDNFNEYWDSICNSSLLKDALQQAFEAGQDCTREHELEEHNDLWFERGFQAGLASAREEFSELMKNIKDHVDTPDREQWVKEQEQKEGNKK